MRVQIPVFVTPIVLFNLYYLNCSCHLDRLCDHKIMLSTIWAMNLLAMLCIFDFVRAANEWQLALACTYPCCIISDGYSFTLSIFKKY